MSKGNVCKEKSHRPHWEVIQRNQRCSAFDGYQRMWSPNSDVRCAVCFCIWRTGAAYVDALPNAKPGWTNAKPVALPPEDLCKPN